MAIDPRILKKAKKILKEKIILEGVLRKELKIYFGKCKTAIQRGQKLPDCKDIIKKNADRIVKSVLNKPIKSIDVNKYQEQLIKKNSKSVAVHAKSINKTNDERLKSALANARQELKDDNTNEDAVNKTAANIFDQSAKKRIGVIAVTETGSISNETRLNLYDLSVDDYGDALEDGDYDSAEEIADLNDSTVMEDGIEEHRNGGSFDDIIGVVLAGQKTWVAVDDEKTCDICASLDGQTVALEDSFCDDDGNEYDSPNDTHFNCRCDILL